MASLHGRNRYSQEPEVKGVGPPFALGKFTPLKCGRNEVQMMLKMMSDLDQNVAEMNFK